MPQMPEAGYCQKMWMISPMSLVLREKSSWTVFWGYVKKDAHPLISDDTQIFLRFCFGFCSTSIAGLFFTYKQYNMCQFWNLQHLPALFPIRQAVFLHLRFDSKRSTSFVKPSLQSCLASFICLGSSECFQNFVTMEWSSSLSSLSRLFGKRQPKYRVCCWPGQKKKFGTFTSIFFPTINE